MKFSDLAKQRCSVRTYEAKPVEEVVIQHLLKSARVAPTAANLQPQKILVLNTAQSLSKVNKSASCHGAPLVMVVLADKNTAWVRPFDRKSMVDIDATIVADHIVMQAEDLGLSSCWITYFDPKILRKEFSIPNELEAVAIISLGYSDTAKNPERHSGMRNSIDTMVFYNHF